ncbi:hypothetical protein [uncultured Tateyamaria sp.]|uniref:hypothetical protein n=1 Tax=uncultured Tateyamaria sp. TaxID=455651 RepID=UPI00262B7FF1|nr:hypothetical protein [uncultured Tateyamaria sp.]
MARNPHPNGKLNQITAAAVTWIATDHCALTSVTMDEIELATAHCTPMKWVTLIG